MRLTHLLVLPAYNLLQMQKKTFSGLLIIGPPEFPWKTCASTKKYFVFSGCTNASVNLDIHPILHIGALKSLTKFIGNPSAYTNHPSSIPCIFIVYTSNDSVSMFIAPQIELSLIKHCGFNCIAIISTSASGCSVYVFLPKPSIN